MRKNTWILLICTLIATVGLALGYILSIDWLMFVGIVAMFIGVVGYLAGGKSKKQKTAQDYERERKERLQRQREESYKRKREAKKKNRGEES